MQKTYQRPYNPLWLAWCNTHQPAAKADAKRRTKMLEQPAAARLRKECKCVKHGTHMTVQGQHAVSQQLTLGRCARVYVSARANAPAVRSTRVAPDCARHSGEALALRS